MSEIKELAAALAKAQAKMKNPKKNKTARVTSKRTGATYTFSYADLGACLDEVRGPLSENGLGLIQEVIRDGTNMSIRTSLVHSSGERLSCDCPIFLSSDQSNQEIGSAITYGRRYGVVLMTGIVAEDDDDANASEGNAAEVGDRRPSPLPPMKSEDAEKAAFGAKLTELKVSFDQAGKSKEWAEIRKTRLLWPFPGPLADLQALVKELDAMVESWKATAPPEASNAVGAADAALALKGHKAKLGLLKRSWLQSCGNNQEKRDEEWAAWAAKEGVSLDDERSEDHVILGLYVWKMERGLKAKTERKTQ